MEILSCLVKFLKIALVACLDSWRLNFPASIISASLVSLSYSPSSLVLMLRGLLLRSGVSIWSGGTQVIPSSVVSSGVTWFGVVGDAVFM